MYQYHIVLVEIPTELSKQVNSQGKQRVRECKSQYPVYMFDSGYKRKWYTGILGGCEGNTVKYITCQRAEQKKEKYQRSHRYPEGMC